VAFAGQLFGGLARSDQRATGELYLRGLILDGKRSSMQPMAARLGVDHQRLQQFVTTPDPAQRLDRRVPHLSATLRPDKPPHPTGPNLTKYY
jgi:SRSO17 transposase